MKRLLLLSFLWAAIGFSQQIVSEEYELRNNDIHLPGSLSYAKGIGKIPLVIFIHGSGNIDRNGNQKGLINTFYIKTLADSLNSKGIAFYRYDKRSATLENLKNIHLEELSVRDFAKDVQVAVDTFSADKRFSSIHLIGHSQGSLVGMLAVNEKISSYTSLAGPGTTVDVSLIRQVTAQSEQFGEITQNHIKELLETDTIATVHPMLMSIFSPANQKFLKNWMLLDPCKEIQNIKIPTLIINGDADSQVRVADAKLLKEAKPDATLVIIKKMNHLLKEVANEAENLQSYTNADVPISSELVKTLVTFIKKNG